MQEQQDWVITILAANRDPLFDASYGDEPCLVNPTCGRESEFLCVAGANNRNDGIELAIFRVNS